MTTPKGGRPRHVPLTQRLVRALQNHRHLSSRPWLKCDGSGKWELRVRPRSDDEGDVCGHRRGVATLPSPVNPTCPKGYTAKGASAALPLLDDARGHRRRRGALHLHPWCVFRRCRSVVSGHRDHSFRAITIRASERSNVVMGCQRITLGKSEVAEWVEAVGDAKRPPRSGGRGLSTRMRRWVP